MRKKYDFGKSKIKPMIIGNTRIVPMTIGETKILPMTFDDTAEENKREMGKWMSLSQLKILFF